MSHVNCALSALKSGSDSSILLYDRQARFSPWFPVSGFSLMRLDGGAAGNDNEMH